MIVACVGIILHHAQIHMPGIMCLPKHPCWQGLMPFHAVLDKTATACLQKTHRSRQ